YVGNASKQDPIVSPIFADLHSLPPMLVHVGSEELLLSDSQTITDHAKRDGVDATLFVGKGLWHGWHFFASYVPEAKQAMKDIAIFVGKHS
ncbi:MAG: alpha/beta hydrolase fold domain-containing protein, partial [Candidatus Doudnabacteria bacterium]|nr:alpha/beta hydrolase fold domain-containing protein [Candidatus Doudnabacteria bacterium]